MKKIIATLISLVVLPTLAIEFERSEYISEIQTGKRKRVASQAALLPEIQYKYGMFQNFLGKYIDRPLFHDRTFRPEKFAFETRESCLSELDIFRNYGLTGAGNLTTSKLRAFNMMCEALSEKPEYTRDYQQYVEFSFQELLDNGKKELPQLLEASRTTLKNALAYPFTGRINNKLFISTYRAGYIDNDLMRQLLEPLREEFGNTFSIMGELIVGNRDVVYFKENGHWTAEHIEKYRTKLTEILELYDGVQIQTGFRERDFKYTFNFNTDIYNQYILPLALELAAEPRFADKLFGTVMNQGYINHMSGSNFGEFGTKTLRQGMDSILKLNPDFIVFFEWNEFNENTCFQPTLYNSLALQKLLKYYSLVLNGGTPLPVAPEKQLIPPLVFSHRETLKVGEELDLELLNIPDSLPGGEYSVVLQLKDIDGKVIKEFPKEEFDSTILRSVTYTVATEQLAPGVVFKPELIVSGVTENYHNNTYSNLQYIRLLPSLCYNYKCVRQPLRDLMQPQEAEFMVERLEDGSDRITANLKCEEKLTAVEITDYGREFYTLDKFNEYDREKNWVIVGTISSQHNKRRSFELEVKNSEEWKFNTWWLPNVNFGRWTKKDNAVTASVWVWGGPIHFMVTIPKRDPDARVCCVIDGETKEFSVSDIVKRGGWGSQYESCRIDWENYLQQVDIAHRLNENSASFDVKLQSHRQYPIYQLRAVTSSGSIYRTPPILPVSLPNALTSLMVHSENKNEIVEVKVCSALLPLMQYKLVNQEYSGDLLTNNFDPFFNGKLGGGYSYGDAFNIFPLPKKNHAPQFVTDVEQPALKFDGSSYITFRQEAFPRGSFTLNFEVKPEAETNKYVLFRHSHHSPGSLVIYVDEEGMKLSYFDRNLKTQHFSSGLLIQPGEWSTISVSYNYNAITFKVNDNQKVIELDKPLLAMYFKPAIFGGHNQAKFGLPEGYEFYHGLMRNLEILHK